MGALPQGMTYAALGFAVLGVCGLMVYAVVKIVLARMSAQGNASNELDTRLPLIIKEATGAWQELNQTQARLIDKAEARADQADTQREAMVQKFVDYATNQTAQYAADLAKTRDQFTESQRRLYARVEQGEKHHQECTHKLDAALEKIKELDQRQYNTALLTPVAAAAMPVAPAAPTTLAVPASGLTITPGFGSPGAHAAG